MPKFRTPFDFRRRVEMARIYLDDGALVTCAAQLEALAKDIREHAAWERGEFEASKNGQEK